MTRVIIISKIEHHLTVDIRCDLYSIIQYWCKAIGITCPYCHGIFRSVAYKQFIRCYNIWISIFCQFTDFVISIVWCTCLTSLVDSRNGSICTGTRQENCLHHICHHVGSCCFHCTSSFGLKFLGCAITKDNPTNIGWFVIGTAIGKSSIGSCHFLTAGSVFVARIASVTRDSVGVNHFWVIDP